VDNGKTEYLLVDSTGGCMGWLMSCLYRRKLETALDAQFRALKEFVEPTG